MMASSSGVTNSAETDRGHLPVGTLDVQVHADAAFLCQWSFCEKAKLSNVTFVVRSERPT